MDRKNSNDSVHVLITFKLISVVIYHFLVFKQCITLIQNVFPVENNPILL